MLSCSAMNLLRKSAGTLEEAFALPLSGRGQSFHCLASSRSHGIFPRAASSALKQTHNPVKTKRNKRYGDERLNHPTSVIRWFHGDFTSKQIF